MSSKLKVEIRNVKSNVKATSRTRISSCNCNDNNKSGSRMNQTSGNRTSGNRTNGNRTSGNLNDQKSNGCKQDRAVAGVQDAGKELSEFFRKLKNEEVAEKLVRAIRNRDAKTINHLLECDCRVVSFFRLQDKDCVRVFCAFGRFNDVTVTFDICIRRF
ncbi:hypothetical protein [Paenibacillus sp. sgz302251]|uniref:hypothetical protein n=1 Tax=Paenibacillus sp. sgz302251 TaxID=3414493 RepID=UPI003C7B7421